MTRPITRTPTRTGTLIRQAVRPGAAASVIALALALGGCATLPAAEPSAASVPAMADPATTTSPSVVVPAGQTLSEMFDTYDAAILSLSPLGKAYRGIRDADYGRWDDPSDAAEVARAQLTNATADAMRKAFDPARLSPADALSFRLFDARAQRAASLLPYRRHGYLFDQMNGAQSDLPAFLINIHRVSSRSEAEAYVHRISGIGPLLDQLIAEADARAAMGIQPPRWVYPYVVADIDNLLRPAAASGFAGHPILDDFTAKVGALDLPDADRQALIAQARTAWAQGARPAYERLRAAMVRQQAGAPSADGVWRLPDGANYYAALLKNYTTTDLSADQIHQLGLSEVARIHREMDAIIARVGFKGDRQAFFRHLRDDLRFYAPTREAYLKQVDTVMAAMTARLPQYFVTLPRSALAIKPVEPFREQSAGKAFYSSPAPDGSRPGTYYVNLYNLRDMSLTELEALAYHEGVPGHHLQRAVQTELTDIPPFRRFGGVTAYTEGWGLYSEELGKDMGFYTDPYSDFGRLQMELWRACRLVVDTGIHHKRWSREQAIAYLTANTPNPAGDVEKAIERYIVYPGQATAYTIGKLKIMELRARARDRLGDRFDIRQFHETILRPGPVPLDVLEEIVDAWIARGGTTG